MDRSQPTEFHPWSEGPFILPKCPLKAGYNPDLIIVSNNINGLCKKILSNPVLQSQYCPIGIQVKAAITSNKVPLNYRKADWNGFTKEFEQAIQRLTALPRTSTLSLTLSRQGLAGTSHEGVEWNTYLAALMKQLKNTKSTSTCLKLTLLLTSAKGIKVMEHISKERLKT